MIDQVGPPCIIIFYVNQDELDHFLNFLICPKVKSFNQDFTPVLTIDYGLLTNLTSIFTLNCREVQSNKVSFLAAPISHEAPSNMVSFLTPLTYHEARWTFQLAQSVSFQKEKIAA
jgi:hypothetical protein